jgi:hypothetical protein
MTRGLKLAMHQAHSLRAVAGLACASLCMTGFSAGDAQELSVGFGSVIQAANPVPQACYSIDWSTVNHDIAQLQETEAGLKSDIDFLDSLDSELSSNQNGLIGAQVVNGTVGFADIYVSALRKIAVKLDRTNTAKWLMLTADVTVGFSTAVFNGVSIGDAKTRDQQVTQDVLGTFYKVGSAAISAAKSQLTDGRQLLGENIGVALKIKGHADAINGLVDKGIAYGKRAQQMAEISDELSAHKKSVRADIARLFDIAHQTRVKISALQRDAQSVSAHCTEGQANQTTALRCAQMSTDTGQSADAKTFTSSFAQLKKECPLKDAEAARMAYMSKASKGQQAETARRFDVSSQQVQSDLRDARTAAQETYNNNAAISSSYQSFQQAQIFDAQHRAAQSAQTSNQSATKSSASGGQGTYICQGQWVIDRETTGGGKRCDGKLIMQH